MISEASSKRAVLLCLLQSLAGVIFGWSNAEGSGLVSYLSVSRSNCANAAYSSRWERTRGVSASVMPAATVLLAPPVKVPSLVYWVPVPLLVPSLPVPLPIVYVHSVSEDHRSNTLTVPARPEKDRPSHDLDLPRRRCH